MTVPVRLHLALHGFVPNPAFGTPSVSFQLPSAAPARLELLDLTGRRILARDVGALGPGSHVVTLREAGSLPAGAYSVRLVQAGRSEATKGVIVR